MGRKYRQVLGIYLIEKNIENFLKLYNLVLNYNEKKQKQHFKNFDSFTEIFFTLFGIFQNLIP